MQNDITFKENVALAPLTTIKLGGTARYFVTCTTEEDVIVALKKARAMNLPVHVLGGGSNTLFDDSGFNGLVMHIAIDGTQFTQSLKTVTANIGAGVVWDGFVAHCVEKGYTGIEALSGIPGWVGAAPIQNIGAYGQEVAETITGVRAIDRSTHNTVMFSNDECEFGYRRSRFKYKDKERYIITQVILELTQGADPIIRYPSLAAQLAQTDQPATLQQVRDTVLTIRKKKSMIIDAKDPNSVSCGSFFTNPIISAAEFADAQSRAHNNGIHAEIPHFNITTGIKIPAAWLIEAVGYHKGFTAGNVGLSEHHSLAIINRGNATTADVLVLQEEIQERVMATFGIELEREPVLVHEKNALIQ